MQGQAQDLGGTNKRMEDGVDSIVEGELIIIKREQALINLSEENAENIQ